MHCKGHFWTNFKNSEEIQRTAKQYAKNDVQFIGIDKQIFHKI
jgi:basic membrane lipoprotein Med (substrate-binding protein (PBP1-ABC) superfamily)